MTGWVGLTSITLMSHDSQCSPSYPSWHLHFSHTHSPTPPHIRCRWRGKPYKRASTTHIRYTCMYAHAHTHAAFPPIHSTTATPAPSCTYPRRCGSVCPTHPEWVHWVDAAKSVWRAVTYLPCVGQSGRGETAETGPTAATHSITYRRI